jgi:hypothetical protein
MIDHQAEQARQDKLEELYTADGRHDPSHPMHQLYTGLWVAYVNSQKDKQQ